MAGEPEYGSYVDAPFGRVEAEGGECAGTTQGLDLIDYFVAAIVTRAGVAL